jgi:hypothetical protein
MKSSAITSYTSAYSSGAEGVTQASAKEVLDSLDSYSSSSDPYTAKARSMPEKFCPISPAVAKRTRPRFISLFIGPCSDDKLFYAKINKWIATASPEQHDSYKEMGRRFTQSVKTRDAELLLTFFDDITTPPAFLHEFSWVKGLAIYGHEAKQLPELPSSVIDLRIRYCESLTAVPRLPVGLKKLLVYCCPLAKLPMLPPFLSTLDLQRNDLTEVPEFSTYVQDLDLCFNKLSSLPNKPYHFYTLNISHNEFVHLPQAVVNMERPSLAWDLICNPWSEKADKQIREKFRYYSSYSW